MKQTDLSHRLHFHPLVAMLLVIATAVALVTLYFQKEFLLVLLRNYSYIKEGVLSDVIKKSRSVMFIYPHPDDELWAAGTLGYLCKDNHYRCSLVSFNKNGKYADGNEESARFLGNADYIRLPDRRKISKVDCEEDKDPDCFVRTWRANGVKTELIKVLQEKKPDIVFTFEPDSKTELSLTHAASSMLAAEAIKESGIKTTQYYVIQTLHLPQSQADIKKIGATDMVDLNNDLWDYKIKIISIYSPFYPSLAKIINDENYQVGIAHQEFFRRK